MTAHRICIVAASLLLLAACGDSSPNQNNNCPEGHERRGEACVPIFDDCPGPAEISVLGGGCRPVGVTECATGFVSDGEGGCDPVFPSEPCPPGTMEMIGLTECQPVGVTECGYGFVSDGEGGCDAVLPEQPCPFGTMEVLGYTECQPIGDCGTGTWGNITTDATTVFVDASADATGADGSDASPFATIADALLVVEPGGQIAVASGEYAERLLITQPVELVGRCAELVTIRGTRVLGQDRPPVTINSSGSGAIIRGVTLTGDAEGLVVTGAQGLTVEEVRVVDTGSCGIRLTDEAGVSVRRVVVAGCTELGVYVLGSSLHLSESVVRDTSALTGGTLGRGIEAQCDADGRGSLSVERSLVAGNRESGILLGGVDATVTSTVVRDTLPRESNGIFGWGINAQCHPVVGNCGSLSVDRSLVAGNTNIGISVFGVDATVISTVVRDTLPEQIDGTGGRGINAQCHLEVGNCGSLSVEGSLVAGNRVMGIFVGSVDANVTSTVVRDTLADGDGKFGQGIVAECDERVGNCGSLGVERSLVAGNSYMGIFIKGVDTAVTSTVVRDTLADVDGMFGRGIEAQCEADGRGSLSVEGSLVAGNADIGILILGVDTAVTSTVVRNTLGDVDGMFGRGINAQCHPEVGNCGSLSVVGSLVAGNRELGIYVSGLDAAVTSTVVRDTLPNGEGTGGRGINAQCDIDVGACGSLSVEQSLVAGSRNLGIFIAGMPATLQGVAVKDTRPNDEGRWKDDFGQAIWAMCDERTGDCGTLAMTSCLMESSYTTGLAVQGVPGFIESSLINSVVPRPLDDAFGYGIQVEGLENLQPLGFDVRSCLIRDASLAAILYSHARGAISSTSTNGGQFAVVANIGSSPEIAENNDLTGTVQDGLFWGNMEPSPAPAPAVPVEPTEPTG